jgi:putative membrane protein
MKIIGFKKVALVMAVCALAIPVVAADTMTTNEPATPMVTPADFAWDAGMINLKEIRLGEAAQTNSQNAAVQEFARHMVRDHTKMNDRLVKIADKEGLQLPEATTFYTVITPPEEKPATELMEESPQERLRDAQLDAQRLESLTSPDFDRAYADAMVKGHEKAEQMYENAVSSLTDPALKKYAESGLRNVRHHLEMAQKLDEQVNGTSTAPASSMPSM